MENFDAEKFNALWNRVTDRNNDPDADIDVLRRIMDAKASQIDIYGAFLRHTRCVGIRAVSEIFAAEKIHLRRLQTMHFILTGDTYAPGIRKCTETDGLELLRLCHRSETNLCTLLRSAWSACGRERLGDAYAEVLDDEREHIRILESVIETVLR